MLKIQEPLSQSQTAVGIDLGTTHSLIASYDGEQVSFYSDNSCEIVPSLVAYHSNGTVVGDAARNNVDAISSIKRWMGKSFDEVKNESQYQPVTKQGYLAVETEVGPKWPVEVSADILSHLVTLTALPQPVSAVITVPAYFDEQSRQATKEAAMLAGIKVMRLLNEPTAAAIAYGLDSKAQGHCLVYDLGGGTFDISLLKIESGVIRVLATGGDTQLGGDDYDKAIVSHWFDVHAIDSETLTASQLRQWQQHARMAKEALTTDSEYSAEFEGVRLHLTVATLDKVTHTLTHQTLELLKEVMSSQSLSFDALDDVILVGGATRMPLVQKAVAECTKLAPKCSLCPDKVVAMGAAMQAAKLSGKSDAMTLLDVLPLSVGIEMMGGMVEKIMLRNTPIPAIASQKFTTAKDNQTGLVFHITQGEREMAADCRSLAKFSLSGIPPMSAGKAQVEVTFSVDADGLLSVMAIETLSQTKAQIEVKPTHGLALEVIQSMLSSAQSMATEDIALRERAQMIQTIKQIQYQLSQILESGAQWLTPQLIEEATLAIAEFGSINESMPLSTLKKLLESAEALSQTYGSAHINYALTETLKGHHVDEIN